MTFDARRRRRIEVRLFFGLWILYGVLIEDHDVTTFNLQQMGVEAIVERGVFYVDGSPTPELKPGGDTFEHEGHLYAAKQPGQFMAGAVVYLVLHALGLSYQGEYLLVAALVTFFTAAMFTALAAVAVFRVALAWSSGSFPWALVAALSFGVASTAVPYSGVAHHDALASAYLVIAFGLLATFDAAEHARAARARAGVAGLLLGLTVTTSMLPFFMVVAAGLYFLALRRWQLVPHFAAGALGGLAPVFFYNYVNFGNPFLVANVAGSEQFSDTFFLGDWRNFIRKAGFYAKDITLYVPLFWLGLGGYLFFPRALARQRLGVVALLAGLFGYVLNIETIGGCQYGPRYLLPTMPLAALGIAGYAHLASPSARRAAAAIVLGVGLFSAASNVLGAMYGAMYCDLRRYAFAHYLDAVRHDVFRHFPLAPWLVVPLGVWLWRLFDPPPERVG